MNSIMLKTEINKFPKSQTCVVHSWLFHIKSLVSKTHFVGFNQLLTFLRLLASKNDAFISWLLCIWTTTADWLSSFDPQLLLGFFLIKSKGQGQWDAYVRKRNANQAAIAFHCYVPALVLRLLVPFYLCYMSSVYCSVIQFTVVQYCDMLQTIFSFNGCRCVVPLAADEENRRSTKNNREAERTTRAFLDREYLFSTTDCVS
jgi:hypothetical protein